MYRAEQRRERRAQADLMQTIAFGYGACKSKDGGKAMEKMVRELRK